MGVLAPTIGAWYQDSTEGKLFEIVAIDEKNSAIEVQYEDGNIGEFDFETWAQLYLSAAAAPEDANAAYETGYEDDMQNEFYYTNGAYSSPLEMIEPDSFPDFDDVF